MTVNRGIFVRQNGSVGTTPREARLSLAGLVAENSPGVPRSGLMDPGTATVVTGAGDMSYNVAAVQAVISRVVGEGVYMPTFTGSTAIPTTPAPGSGSRYDLIWIKQNDVEKGDADNLAVAGVTQGTPATSPARPTSSVPAGALVIAEALVMAGALSTDSAQVTIAQTFPYTTGRGAPIPVRSLTERGDITGRNGVQVRRIDLNGLIETYRNGAWVSDIYALAAGTQSGSMSAQSSTSFAVTFPSGRFTQPPIITLGKAMSTGAKLAFYAVSVTASGFVLGVQTSDGSTFTGSVACYWHATQMTSTSGAG